MNLGLGFNSGWRTRSVTRGFLVFLELCFDLVVLFLLGEKIKVTGCDSLRVLVIIAVVLVRVLLRGRGGRSGP